MTDETIFATALEKSDPAERAAYLAEVCGADAVLRARVEELLAAHARAGDFLERPAAADPAPTADAPGDPADADVLRLLGLSGPPGALGRFAHYAVQEVVGRGGFGVVLKAFDERLHRVVAIKALDPRLAVNGASHRRFEREARSAAAVRNDHVVAIHAVSGDDAPVPYLVMEYIDGRTLQQKLDATGPLGLKEVLRIGMQVAAGLAAAHAQGLVHRDIKPANILLENGVERVKITDFGLARAVDDTTVTQSGVVAGSPLYMSPEQAQGLAVDHRSDLFSLGSVLYAMCTGRPPFRGETTLAVLKRVAEAKPRPVREMNPEVPSWLADVVAKLHAERPGDRFQSAAEVAGLLADYLAEVQNPNWVARAPKRNRWKWIAAALAILIAAAVTEVTGLTQMLRGRTPGVVSSVGGEPTEPPRPHNPGYMEPGQVGEPVDSRAYLPLSENKLRRVTDFAEIHAAHPEEVVKWAETLGPRFGTIALGDHPTADPPQTHAVAVQLDGHSVEAKVTFGRYADHGPLAERMHRAGYWIPHIRYPTLKGELYDLSLWLRDSVFWAFQTIPNRGMDQHLADFRKRGMKPRMLLPCFALNPALTNIHWLGDSGRNRWRTVMDLTAEQLGAFAEDTRSADLFVSLVNAYRTERGETRFGVVAWENPAALKWVFKAGLRTAEYEAELAAQRKAGLRPVTVTSYGDAKGPLYAASWVQYKR